MKFLFLVAFLLIHASAFSDCQASVQDNSKEKFLMKLLELEKADFESLDTLSSHLDDYYDCRKKCSRWGVIESISEIKDLKDKFKIYYFNIRYEIMCIKRDDIEGVFKGIERQRVVPGEGAS